MTLDITVTDMFCGAGGSTTGAVLAGATVKMAINHWARAIETHNSNYPNTKHVLTDLHEASPRRFPSTTILMASPECTNHSLAKGRKRKKQAMVALPGMESEPDLGAEAEERSRCTMWTPLDWAEYHDYQAVILENVVDAHLWRPFEAWLHAWDSLEYEFEIVHLNSMHAHPTPQSRDRMYFVAWKKGNRKPNLKITPLAHCKRCEKDVNAIQVWKNSKKRYGKYRFQYFYGCPGCDKEVEPYYYPAASAIDWAEAAPRIADRAKPLEKKTMERIADGLKKFAQPYLVNMNHSNVRPVAIEEMPFYTQTAYDATGLAVPPFIMDHIGEYRTRAITNPLSTICAGGNHQSLIVPQVKQYILPYYSNGKLAPAETVALPTVTTVDRHAVVTLEPGEIPAVEECGFRMLSPKEIRAAMAFPKDYIITGTRREQVKQLGNGVTPPAMKLLMERVIESLA